MRQSTSNSANIIKYLSLYEDMTNYQENEVDSCVNYLRPLFTRIRVLGGDAKNNEKEYSINTSKSSNKLLPPLDESDDDDDSYSCHYQSLSSRKAKKDTNYLASTISIKGLYKVLKYLKLQSKENDYNEYDELITTDEQFVMTLEQLYKLNSSCYDKYFTFLELVHCYKTIVDGMMLMKLASNYDSGSQSKGELSCSYTTTQEEEDIVQMSRCMIRDRTMDMLSVFSDEKAVKETEEKPSEKNDQKKDETKVFSLDKETSSNVQVDDSKREVTIDEKQISDAQHNHVKVGSEKDNFHVSLTFLSGLILTLVNFYMFYTSKSSISTTTLSVPQFFPKLYNENDKLKNSAFKSTKELHDDDRMIFLDEMKSTNERELAIDISSKVSTHLDVKLAAIEQSVLQTIKHSMHQVFQKNKKEEISNAIIQKQSNIISLLLVTTMHQQYRHQEQIILIKNNCQEQIALTEKHFSLINDNASQQQCADDAIVDGVECNENTNSDIVKEKKIQFLKLWKAIKNFFVKLKV